MHFRRENQKGRKYENPKNSDLFAFSNFRPAMEKTRPIIAKHDAFFLFWNRVFFFYLTCLRAFALARRKVKNTTKSLLVVLSTFCPATWKKFMFSDFRIFATPDKGRNERCSFRMAWWNAKRLKTPQSHRLLSCWPFAQSSSRQKCAGKNVNIELIYLEEFPSKSYIL